MTGYELRRTTDDNFDLVDGDGNVLESYEPPIEGVKETLLPAILDDIGIEEGPFGEVRDAIMFVATGDIEMIDDREA